nr:MAG: MaoC family dehydratase [Hyphomicrobiales bacterium]
MNEHLRFEDFTEGRKFSFGDHVISEKEMIDFAREYDPQPMHIDPVAAKYDMMGGLIASGWHLCALAMRLTKDGLYDDRTSLGSPGVDEVQWRRPVRPNDRLSMEAEVLEARFSNSKPDRGIVRFRFDLYRTDGQGKRELAITYTSPVMIRKRDA